MRAAELIRCADGGALAGAVARAVQRALHDALEARGSAALAVAGGSTPRRYLPAVAALPLPWQRVSVTLTDERWVAPDSPDSNERLVRDLLLTGPAASARFVGLKTAEATPAAALATVEARLAAVSWPLDLAVLGIGDDGHIASLFPGGPCAADGRTVATTAPAPPRARISLTLSTLAAARHLVLVSAGADKRALIESVLDGGRPELPVARLCAAVGPRLRAIVID